MTETLLQIRLLEGAGPEFVPRRSTEGAAGLDVRAFLDPPTVARWLEPGGRNLVPLGFSMAMELGMECQIRPRSGLALHHGITVLNTPGTVDSDYRGVWAVILINHSQRPFRIDHGMRIAQLVFSRLVPVRMRQVDALPESQRGSGGYGSTGTG